MSSDQKRVLVCPLDWGLGHASRMIPVIRQFLLDGQQVVLGISGISGELLKLTFPDLPFIVIPGVQIRYAANKRWFTVNLLKQLPAFAGSFFREHRRIKRIVERHHIHTIVSDNRYGLFCRNAYCIFVTHQVSPVLPLWCRWAEYPLYLLIRTIILQYNECWIPDFDDPEHNLSGKLSHRFKLPRNAHYIGMLSRFHHMIPSRRCHPEWEYDIVTIASGPEPQRSILCSIMMDLSVTIKKRILIITGLVLKERDKNKAEHHDVIVVSHLDPETFYYVMLHADIIIGRSGYSSLMDLAVMGKSALLVPTPGQPEQEYLAEYLTGKGLFTAVPQHHLTSGYLLKYLENDFQIKKTVTMTRNPIRNPE